MATLEKAIELATKAHAGQKDKDGHAYILHPLRVMHRVEGDDAKTVAVLHDTIEDTSLTEADLRAAGFGEPIVAAVVALTHSDEEPYAEYVVRCSQSDLARPVKMADLEDNARL